MIDMMLPKWQAVFLSSESQKLQMGGGVSSKEFHLRGILVELYSYNGALQPSSKLCFVYFIGNASFRYVSKIKQG